MTARRSGDETQQHRLAAGSNSIATPPVSPLVKARLNTSDLEPDGTNEGLRYTGKNIFTVQFHPEASPGPRDSGVLFDRFMKMMEVKKNA